MVLASGPITAPWRLRRLNGRFTISGRRTSGPRCGRKEGPRGREGSVTPRVDQLTVPGLDPKCLVLGIAENNV